MQRSNLTGILEQPFSPVKSGTSPSLSPGAGRMIHHKVPVYRKERRRIVYCRDLRDGYGVSCSRGILSPSLFLRKFDYIRDCLKQRLGLTTAQREVALRLLRLYSYYGAAYPKESQITSDPGCRKATFWRTVKLLEELGLVEVVNRFLIRPHAQISNLYRLDRLVVVIARYLADHIAHVWPDWLKPALAMPPRLFWGFLAPGPGDRAGPAIPAF